MKNIIPFKKDIAFKTNLSEITSISLENNLNIKDNTIIGDFIVSGEYKVSDKSNTVEPFEIKLPFEIEISDRYDSSKAVVDIDDFYYEILNNNTLSISIDVLIDHLQDKPLIEEVPQDIVNKESEEEDMFYDNLDEKEEVIDGRCIEDEETDEQELREDENLVEDKINSIFSNTNNDSEVYVTYNVFIVRDGDTLESILEKYNITEEELKKYNDLTNLKLGDKLIIPNSYERD